MKRRLAIDLPHAYSVDTHTSSSSPSRSKLKRTHQNEKRPDFKALAKKYPTSFGRYVQLDEKGNPHINWQDPNALIALQQVMLFDAYQIRWKLPIDRLCPPVNGRLNYVLWLQDLLALSPLSTLGIRRGVDIGTGASLIYPLLGSRIAGWHFLATEVDSISASHAKELITMNEYCSDLISIRPVSNSKYILKNVIKSSDGQFDFCMCNPPFYSNMEEAQKAHFISRRRETSTGGFAPARPAMYLYTPGGEERFTLQIVQESFQFRTQFRWFTTMVGKKSTLKVIYNALREAAVENICTSDLVQGRSTRWVIGWSFTNDGLDLVSRSKELSQMTDSKGKHSNIEKIEKIHPARLRVLRNRADKSLFGKKNKWTKKNTDTLFSSNNPRNFEFDVDFKNVSVKNSIIEVHQRAIECIQENFVDNSMDTSSKISMCQEDHMSNISIEKVASSEQCDRIDVLVHSQMKGGHSMKFDFCIVIKSKSITSKKESKCIESNSLCQKSVPKEEISQMSCISNNSTTRVTISMIMLSGEEHLFTDFRLLKDKLQADIQRTNRKWRRKQKRR